MTDNLEIWNKLGKTAKVYGSVSDRVWNLVAPEPNTGCWLWLGAVNHSGYGTMTIGRRTRMAHRASYEAHKGAIPEGLAIDHRCKVRSCVNPDHLEPVTTAENNRRSPKMTPLATHCIHGHPFSGDNLSWDGKQRRCKECNRIVALRSWRKKNGKL